MNCIKKWLADTIFHKELKSVLDNCQAQIEKNKKESEQIIRQTNSTLNSIRTALRDGYKIVSEVDNNIGEHVIVAEKTERKNPSEVTIVLRLYSNRYSRNNCPTLMATYYKENKTTGSKTPYIYIIDIQGCEVNRGNGTILMTNFIKLCRLTDAVYVAGFLSPSDKEHFDRSSHFYQKHGFQVTLDQTGDTGSIKLIL